MGQFNVVLKADYPKGEQMKKIAQICPHCKECFITGKRLSACPFCEKDIPQKQKTKVEIKVESLNRKFDEITEEPSTDIIKEFLTVNDQIHLLYNLVYGFLSKNNEVLKAKTLSSEELCDFGFFCREIENIFDELRKEAKARKELCGQIIAYRLVQASLNDPTLSMKVKGQFATGSPDVKMQAALPVKFTDDYFKITDHLGVPRDVAATGVLRLDWKAVTEYLTKLMNDGKSIPEGFGKKYPVYTTVYRKSRRK